MEEVHRTDDDGSPVFCGPSGLVPLGASWGSRALSLQWRLGVGRKSPPDTNCFIVCRWSSRVRLGMVAGCLGIFLAFPASQKAKAHVQIYCGFASDSELEHVLPRVIWPSRAGFHILIQLVCKSLLPPETLDVCIAAGSYWRDEGAHAIRLARLRRVFVPPGPDSL